MAQSEFVAQNGPDKKIYYGTAAPTAGTYQRGDWCINTAPSAAGTSHWVCTTGGATGTFVWKAVSCAA